MTIRWIDKRLGYGVFANRDFESKEFIGEYIGLVRRLYRFQPENNPYCLQYPSLFFSFTPYMVDAQHQGNETRFLNHSYKPNLEMDILLDNGLMHIGFFTNQPISKGTQLTFNYGKDYWKTRERPIEI